MTIKAILAHRDGTVHGCERTERVGAVSRRLAEQRIGAMPVIDQGQVIGIFSERDLVHCLSVHGAAALGLTVDAAMTSPPVTVAPDTHVMAALSLMTRRRIRHLPVLDGDRLVGFISIGDLVKYRIDRIETEAAAMRDYIASV